MPFMKLKSVHKYDEYASIFQACIRRPSSYREILATSKSLELPLSQFAPYYLQLKVNEGIKAEKGIGRWW